VKGTFFLCLVAPFLAAAQNPFAGNAKETDVGRGLFRIICAPCHGIQAKGGRGPDLTLGVYHAGTEDQDLHRVIADGVAGTEMPGFVERIGSDNAWRLVAYIRSATERTNTVINGDRARGEKLFWSKGGCGGCHRVGSRGHRMGPDLSRVGRTRSAAFLRRSMTDPNADLTPGFYKVTVVTRDGKKISGVQRGYDNFSAQLMDAKENILSFNREDVQSMDRELISMMPTYNNLPAQELDDLLAYLVSLEGGKS
jgi:putative heme-binding domain-containing protein